MTLKKIIKASLLMALLAFSAVTYASSEEEQKIGIVDFRVCLEKSYLGQAEQKKLEAMRNEMVSTLEDKEKMLSEVMDKLNKPEYLDTISVQAEEELKKQYASLSEEMQMLQNQAYQALNQAQMKMVQNVSEQIAKSAEYLAREHQLDLVLNQETCFYFKRPLDLTPLVLQDLNRHFQPEESTAQANKAGEI